MSSCEDKGRDWCNMTASQGMLKVSDRPDTRKRQGRTPLQVSWGHGLVGPLITGF